MKHLIDPKNLAQTLHERYSECYRSLENLESEVIDFDYTQESSEGINEFNLNEYHPDVAFVINKTVEFALEAQHKLDELLLNVEDMINKHEDYTWPPVDGPDDDEF